MGIDCCCSEALFEAEKEIGTQISKESSTDESILECDYDTHVTKLYRSIEQRKWEEVLYYLETKQWYTRPLFSFWSDPEDPPTVQTRTWVTAFDKGGNVRWCQLPIHAAITFNAPYSIIFKLIEEYPKSIRCADDQDMLPLHYAFRFGAEDDVLLHLLEKFPQAVSKKAVKDRLPLDLAQFGPRPERGSIIACYMQSAVRNAKNEWDDEYESMVANMKGVADHELQHHLKVKTSKLASTRAELYSTKQEVQALRQELEYIKRNSKWNDASVRSLKRSTDASVEISLASGGGPVEMTEVESDECEEKEEHRAIKSPIRTRTNHHQTTNPKQIRSLSGQPRKKPNEGSRRSSRTRDASSQRTRGRKVVDDISSKRSIKTQRSSSKGPKGRTPKNKIHPNILKLFGITRK